jgi:hypothetical protein
MNKLIMILPLTFLYVGFASADSIRNDDWLESNKKVTVEVKKEIREFLTKNSEITKDCKLKRKQLKDSLSPDAKKILKGRKSKKKQSIKAKDGNVTAGDNGNIGNGKNVESTTGAVNTGIKDLKPNKPI